MYDEFPYVMISLCLLLYLRRVLERRSLQRALRRRDIVVEIFAAYLKCHFQNFLECAKENHLKRVKNNKFMDGL